MHHLPNQLDNLQLVHQVEDMSLISQGNIARQFTVGILHNPRLRFTASIDVLKNQTAAANHQH